MDFYGRETKKIVSEHNTHVGDGRATKMVGGGMANTGQMGREDTSD